jgi:hypothetical protein
MFNREGEEKDVRICSKPVTRRCGWPPAKTDPKGGLSFTFGRVCQTILRFTKELNPRNRERETRVQQQTKTKERKDSTDATQPPTLCMPLPKERATTEEEQGQEGINQISKTTGRGNARKCADLLHSELLDEGDEVFLIVGRVAHIPRVPVALPPEKAGDLVTFGTWVKRRDVGEDLVCTEDVAVVLNAGL